MPATKTKTNDNNNNNDNNNTPSKKNAATTMKTKTKSRKRNTSSKNATTTTRRRSVRGGAAGGGRRPRLINRGIQAMTWQPPPPQPSLLTQVDTSISATTCRVLGRRYIDRACQTTVSTTMALHQRQTPALPPPPPPPPPPPQVDGNMNNNNYNDNGLTRTNTTSTGTQTHPDDGIFDRNNDNTNADTNSTGEENDTGNGQTTGTQTPPAGDDDAIDDVGNNTNADTNGEENDTGNGQTTETMPEPVTPLPPGVIDVCGPWLEITTTTTTETPNTNNDDDDDNANGEKETLDRPGVQEIGNVAAASGTDTATTNTNNAATNNTTGTNDTGTSSMAAAAGGGGTTTTPTTDTAERDNQNEDDEDDDPNLHLRQHLPQVLRDLKPNPQSMNPKATPILGERVEVKRTILKAYGLHCSVQILQKLLTTLEQEQEQQDQDQSTTTTAAAAAAASSHNNNNCFAKRSLQAVIDTQRLQRDAILNAVPDNHLYYFERFLIKLVRYKMEFGHLDIRLDRTTFPAPSQIRRYRQFRAEADNLRAGGVIGSVPAPRRTTTTTKTAKRKRRSNVHARSVQFFIDEEEQYLEDIGFVWKGPRAYERTWEDWFELLKKFNEEKGHCHVPCNYRTEDGSDARLGDWVRTLRHTYYKLQTGMIQKHGGLTEERIKRLEDIGMVWKIKHGRPLQGDPRFDLKKAAQYKKRGKNKRAADSSKPKAKRRKKAPSPASTPSPPPSPSLPPTPSPPESPTPEQSSPESQYSPIATTRRQQPQRRSAAMERQDLDQHQSTLNSFRRRSQGTGSGRTGRLPPAFTTAATMTNTLPPPPPPPPPPQGWQQQQQQQQLQQHSQAGWLMHAPQQQQQQQQQQQPQHSLGNTTFQHGATNDTFTGFFPFL